MNTLFTIGHSTHSIEEFLSLLQSYCIQAIADVRSQPYSRRFPISFASLAEMISSRIFALKITF